MAITALNQRENHFKKETKRYNFRTIFKYRI